MIVEMEASSNRPLWSNDSELLHSRFQGRRFQTEMLSRAAVAANAEACTLEHVQYMKTLDFVELLSRRGTGFA